MSEQMRSDFEALWGAKGYAAEDLRLDGMGEYEVGETYSAFHWFKSSRAALCVELPDVTRSHYVTHAEYQIGSQAVELCRSAIHAAGVKTK